MTEPTVAHTDETLFADFTTTPAEHFRLHFFGAVLVCIEHAAACAGSFEAAMERFPFLVGYNNELAQRLAGLSAHEAFARWRSALEMWESRASGHLPLRALRQLLGLDATAVMCLVTAGLVEEDARFGAFFESLQGSPGQRRPTAGLLRQCWCEYLPTKDFSPLLRNACAVGVLHSLQPDAAQQDVAFRIPVPMWEALRGDAFGTPLAWARWRDKDSLTPIEELITTPEIRATLAGLARLFQSGETRAVIIRGARHNGRRTLLGALARTMDRSVLEISGQEKIDQAQWREAATLACLRRALPIVCVDLGPGETLFLPESWPAEVPLGIVLGRQGGLAGELTAQAATISLDAPALESRRTHWQRSLGTASDETIGEISARHRLPSGQIHRAARLARMRAALESRAQPTSTDVRKALQTLNREMLDALATRLSTDGDWSWLSASAQTRLELEHLESRCRNRERMPALLDAAPSAGVRALFTGPSGTGKTHAARLLAAQLRKDLYRGDLSGIVDKYVGESEKNLNRIFAAAEELDVILLLDEGDALLGKRSDGGGEMERWARFQTNFLLQRIEEYQGILVVTTNARDQIDSAFERRMDVTIEFHPPDAEERWTLWGLHLPQAHEVSEEFLSEVTSRCEFTGGQIRNATLHAALLALDNGGVVKTAILESAIRREYAKLGGVCPLRHLTENL